MDFFSKKKKRLYGHAHSHSRTCTPVPVVRNVVTCTCGTWTRGICACDQNLNVRYIF